MSKYKKVDSSLNFVDRELEVLKFWKEIVTCYSLEIDIVFYTIDPFS